MSKSPGPLIAVLADTVTRFGYRQLAARLIGSVRSSPGLMAAYWNNYLLTRRATIPALIKIARDRGLVRDDCDPEILLDLVSGASIHHLLLGQANGRAARCALTFSE